MHLYIFDIIELQPKVAERIDAMRWSITIIEWRWNRFGIGGFHPLNIGWLETMMLRLIFLIFIDYHEIVYETSYMEIVPNELWSQLPPTIEIGTLTVFERRIGSQREHTLNIILPLLSSLLRVGK
jgi:hypothetical protein